MINYEFDFSDEATDFDKLKESIQMFNAKFLANGFTKMGNFQYRRFIQYLKINPASKTGQYIVL